MFFCATSITFDFACIEAKNKDEAEKMGKVLFGEHNVKNIGEVTDENARWYKIMGVRMCHVESITQPTFKDTPVKTNAPVKANKEPGKAKARTSTAVPISPAASVKA